MGSLEANSYDLPYLSEATLRVRLPEPGAGFELPEGGEVKRFVITPTESSSLPKLDENQADFNDDSNGAPITTYNNESINDEENRIHSAMADADPSIEVATTAACSTVPDSNWKRKPASPSTPTIPLKRKFNLICPNLLNSVCVLGSDCPYLHPR
jgi:hypothetical protein